MKILRLFKVVSLIKNIWGFARRSSFLEETKIVYMLFIVVIVIFGGALILLILEEGHNTEIMNIMDAVWCTSVTLSSVGYGNGPISTIGKIFEMFLMFSGAILVAALTATTTAWLTKEKEKKEFKQIQCEEDRIYKDLEIIKAAIKKINKELEEINKKT